MKMPRQWLGIPFLFTLLLPLGQSASIGVNLPGGGGSVGISTGGVTGDPILTSFDGRAFEFMGEVGKHYNLISEQTHQLTMRLKLGQMFDHNGTYMDGLGFMYQQHKIVAEVGADDNLTVYLDGQCLKMAKGETEQEHIMALEHGELMIQWEMHRPDMGQAVEITSDLLSVSVFLTPAGTLDEGGVVQPAYLNIDALLLGPPAGAMKGVIGEGYERLTDANAVPEEDDFKFHGDESVYEMGGYFSTEHPHCMFGVPPSTMRLKRRLSEGMHVAFPLRFSSLSRVPGHLPHLHTPKPRMRSLKGVTLRVEPSEIFEVPSRNSNHAVSASPKRAGIRSLKGVTHRVEPRTFSQDSRRTLAERLPSSTSEKSSKSPFLESVLPFVLR